MPYTVDWNSDFVHIIYSGEINNKEIRLAHYEVNNDARFNDCPILILDITDCQMEQVDVPKLIGVAGLDLGNLKLRDGHKIIMLAKDPLNIKKAKTYIKLFKKLTPNIRLFNSVEDAIPWLNLSF